MRRTISILVCFSAALIMMDFLNAIESIRSQHITDVFIIIKRIFSVFGLLSFIYVSLSIISQLGLFLAPLVKEKQLSFRIIVILLMVPFIFLSIVPDFKKALMIISASTFEGWKYFYGDYLSLIGSCLTFGIIYSFTIISLVRGNRNTGKLDTSTYNQKF